jgi:hypothetical protein
MIGPPPFAVTVPAFAQWQLRQFRDVRLDRPRFIARL